jgi:hypothetical protein
MVKERVEALGASEVKSAVMYAHTWGVSVPEYIGLITDALLLNPWDREIWRDGVFQFHPEYVAALAHQGIAPDASLLIEATPIALAKGDTIDELLEEYPSLEREDILACLNYAATNQATL